MWVLNERQSQALVETLLNPPEPSDILRAVSEVYRERVRDTMTKTQQEGRLTNEEIMAEQLRLQEQSRVESRAMWATEQALEYMTRDGVPLTLESLSSATATIYRVAFLEERPRP